MLQQDSITTIKGIGSKTVEKYEKIGISTVGDLLEHFPRDYDEIRPIRQIRSLREGEVAAIEGNMVSRPQEKIHGKLKILTTVMTDHSGAMIDVTWFNMPFLKNQLHMGTNYILRGRVVRKMGRLRIEQPRLYTRQEFHQVSGKLMPIYPLTKGLTNNALTKAEGIAIKECDDLYEYIPKEIRDRQDLIGYKKAITDIHFPASKEELYKSRRRLVFDELFLYVLALKKIRESGSERQSNYVIQEDKTVDSFMDLLPFELTGAQQRAYRDIVSDMSSGRVMTRLVQGDVGSGKTIVALLSLLQVVKNGMQGALMVPTEVLANQHKKTFEELLNLVTGENGLNDSTEEEPRKIVVDNSSIHIEMLTGSMTAKQKKEVKAKLKSGEADIVIGTHALIQDDVEFKDLALVVTDEQHRFGVRQREDFSKKGTEPHVLAMSATPIPRTLALILYGDMDLTVIDEKPANRLPIKNALVGTSFRKKAHDFMKKRVAEGEQCYVICPMIEDDEESELQNVTIYTEELRDELNKNTGTSTHADGSMVQDAPGDEPDRNTGAPTDTPDETGETASPSREIRVAMLHGRMKQSEKDDIMKRFSDHEIDILVSTTVIEVGIDVPNATTMLIENAERFGLAALHQLRGRIGRGSAQSYCIFMMGVDSDEIRERLQIVERTNDGFKVADEDLKRRGQGDLFGTLQSGEKIFALADIYEDARILEAASAEAKEYSLEKLFLDINDLTNEKDSFHGVKNQDKRLLKKIYQYMGDVTL